jgi:hypothetical protein
MRAVNLVNMVNMECGSLLPLSKRQGFPVARTAPAQVPPPKILFHPRSDKSLRGGGILRLASNHNNPYQISRDSHSSLQPCLFRRILSLFAANKHKRLSVNNLHQKPAVSNQAESNLIKLFFCAAANTPIPCNFIGIQPFNAQNHPQSIPKTVTQF